MKTYENGFDIIKTKEDGKVMVLLFLNPFEKKDVHFKVDKSTKTIKILYPNNKHLEFKDVNDNILSCLKRKSNVTVVEIFGENSHLENEGNFEIYSQGDIVDTYKMRAV